MSSEPAAVVSPGGKPPGNPPVLTRGGDPLEPPLVYGPVPPSPGRGPASPGGDPRNPRWPTARFLRHRAGALLTVDVLDVLVPLDPAADPGAQLPPLGLRRPLDRVIELAEPAADAGGHILGKRRPVTERFRELLQVRPRGVVEPPVLAHDVGDVTAVDHALPARSQVVLGQQDDAVDEVVGRELVDLQLGEQQV